MLKIYCDSRKKMVHTIIKEMPIFRNNNIFMTENIDECDIIIGNTRSFLTKLLDKNKILLLWTPEPHHSLNETGFMTVGKHKIHIMNCYTNDVYLNNFLYFSCVAHNPLGGNFYEKFVPKTELRRKIVAIMTYNTDQSREIRIIRTNVALEGHRKGVVDIYGIGWPKGISKGNSRKTYILSKPDILKNYDFSFAFENTNTKYYVTEKIWHAICNFTLPIYYGNSWIYEIFPENSFIDYTKFSSNDELFDFVKNMTVEEYNTRLTKCINVVRDNIKYLSMETMLEPTATALFNKIQKIKPEKNSK